MPLSNSHNRRDVTAGAFLTTPSSPRILVLDNDPAVSEFLVDFLSESGFRAQACYGLGNVETFLDADSGLAVLLFDLHFQPVRVSEATRRLYRRFPDLQIIYTNGFPRDEPSSLEEPPDHRDIAIVPKPIDGPFLIDIVTQATQHLLFRDHTTVPESTRLIRRNIA